MIKQRIARAGEGKSGGSRSIILFQKANRAVFVHGFEKKPRANIGQSELVAFQEPAMVTLAYATAEIAQRVEDGALLKVEGPEEGNDA